MIRLVASVARLLNYFNLGKPCAYGKPMADEVGNSAADAATQ